MKKTLMIVISLVLIICISACGLDEQTAKIKNGAAGTQEKKVIKCESRYVDGELVEIEEYDPFGEWVGTTSLDRGDFSEFETDWKYDSKGRPTEYTFEGPNVFHSNSYKYIYEYDEAGQTVKKSLMQDGSITGAYFDVYDQGGKLIERMEGDGDHFVYEYDSSGKLIKQTDSKGYYHQYNRDDHGRVIREATYDPNGKLITVNQENDYEYDSQGRIIQWWRNGNLYKTYEYETIPSGYGVYILIYDSNGVAEEDEYEERTKDGKLVKSVKNDLFYEYNENEDVTKVIGDYDEVKAYYEYEYWE